MYGDEDWDQDLYALKVSIKYDNVPKGSYLTLNLKYHYAVKHESIQSTGTNRSTSAQALITVSHTKVTKLSAGEDLFGELNHGNYRFHLYKILVPNAKMVTKISYSMCLGTV